MNYNPYAPPGAPVAPDAIAVAVGAPQPWTAGEVIGVAWAKFRENVPILLGSYFLVAVLGAGTGQVHNIARLAFHVPAQSGSSIGLALFGFLAGQCVAAFLQVGFLRMLLVTARGGQPTMAMLFSGADRFLPMLGCTLLISLAIVLGLILLIVPGVIVALGLAFSTIYVVDTPMGPIEAMKASWSATSGQKGEVFVLALYGCALGLVGALACCVGIFATVPVYMLGTVVAYTRLSGRGTVPLGTDP